MEGRNFPGNGKKIPLNYYNLEIKGPSGRYGKRSNSSLLVYVCVTRQKNNNYRDNKKNQKNKAPLRKLVDFLPLSWQSTWEEVSFGGTRESDIPVGSTLPVPVETLDQHSSLPLSVQGSAIYLKHNRLPGFSNRS